MLDLKTVAVLSLIVTGSVRPASAQLPADSGALIVRLGRDTLKVERFVIRDRVIRSESIRRGSAVELQQVDMVLAPDGSLAWGQMRIYKWPLEPMARPTAGSQVYVQGDSTILELTLPPVTRRVAYAGRGNIFNVAAQPFMFTLYAAIAAHAPSSVGDSVISQHMASTLGVRKLVVKRAAADLVTAESSIMGLMRIRVDSARRVTALDGTGSSLNFQGERVGWVNLDSVARSFENMNRRTGGIGSLSPRDSAVVTVAGARLETNYSRPSKRGRVVFGGIVPWNRVWRTGANLSTHFTTDRPLAFGATVVPAGRYTLFTLPAQNGWTLIISKQTGQWGTEYDGAHDLARIPMRTRSLAPAVEQFTMIVEPRARGGILRLQWDTTEAYAEFTVR